MYPIIPLTIFVIFLILLPLWKHARKSRLLRKVSDMPPAKKSALLTDLTAPFGFSYLSVQDILIFKADAPCSMETDQSGYGAAYGQPALPERFVLDSEPVYFNYQGRTWLIVFRKGQYGIHTGAEAGIYHADRIVPPALRPQTVFEAASGDETVLVKMRLLGSDCPLFSVTQRQGRSGGFVTGVCVSPDDLLLEISITFPDMDMCNAFTRAMNGLGYQNSKLLLCQSTVQFYFTAPKAVPLAVPDDLLRNYVLHKNLFFCKLFLWITEPFFTASDRLLYLYYAYPFLFRRALSVHRSRFFTKHLPKNRGWTV